MRTPAPLTLIFTAVPLLAATLAVAAPGGSAGRRQTADGRRQTAAESREGAVGRRQRAQSSPTPPSPNTQNSIPNTPTDFFELKIRPLLVRRCGQCHGATKPAGGLSLATRAGFLKGGAHGPVVSAGNPDDSLLLRVVHRTPGVPAMPPSGALPQSEVTALETWVRAGAVWPEAQAQHSTPNTQHSDWAWQPLRRPPVPQIRNRQSTIGNPIDAFVLQKLQKHGMRPALPAGKLELMRRACFDLTGLPPTPDEVRAYMADTSADAYERLVDRLLASPRYGERWARYWLDLVRYADSNGYERDAEKPYSWKYRDYVIRSLNEDKPFDRFVTEQLAGDELPDRTEETVAATGFLRLGTWDDEPNDPVEYQYERLDDLVHTTTTAFLGLTVRCARCHDHKFDPIPQKDYYAIGAAFWGGYVQPGDGRHLGGPPPEKLGYPQLLGFTDAGPQPAPLHLLQAGDPRREGPVVEPGYLSLVPALQRPVAPAPSGAATSRRRLQLAAWITDPRNPLTPRVIVNRIWQHHFGYGLVRTPNNFGRKGAPPTHPELLDWLASSFLSGDSTADLQRPTPNAQRLKWLHRLIMLSSTYRMASVHPEQAAYEQKDFGNELLWRFNRRRLDADALRDAMLAVSGQLNLEMGGRGFTPTVSREALEGLSRKGAEWFVSPPEEQRRRTVYMFLKRALLMPFLTAFDFGDTTQPIEQRESSIVAPQALALLNNSFSHEQSRALAARVLTDAGPDPARQIDRVWRLTLSRPPDAAERDAALRHLQRVAGLSGRAGTPGPSPRSPESLPALKLWLRADEGVTLDEQGRVTAWRDQSGSGHDAAQPSAAARPELTPAAVGGRPALRFDGQGRFLALAGQVLRSPDFTLVAVASDRAGGGSHREIFSNWTRNGNIGPAVFLGTTGAGTVRFSDAFAPAGNLDHPERPHALTAVTAPTASMVYQNRVTLAERAAGLPDRRLDTPYVIGTQGDINGEFWNGDIAEILVYDRALSPQELSGVWDYLEQKYGVAARPTPPSPQEQALSSLCHALLNSNEFLFID
jgi:hypothetical protein